MKWMCHYHCCLRSKRSNKSSTTAINKWRRSPHGITNPLLLFKSQRQGCGYNVNISSAMSAALQFLTAIIAYGHTTRVDPCLRTRIKLKYSILIWNRELSRERNVCNMWRLLKRSSGARGMLCMRLLPTVFKGCKGPCRAVNSSFACHLNPLIKEPPAY